MYEVYQSILVEIYSTLYCCSCTQKDVWQVTACVWRILYFYQTESGQVVCA
jgi:hypothetical protein